MNEMPVIAEIVGTSGAGKSTLSATINSMDRGVVAGLTVWGLPLVSLSISGIASVPEILNFIWARKRVRKEELKQVIRMNAFHRLLQKKRAASGGIYNAFLLDEGVVFALAKLRADNDSTIVSRRIRRWEQRILARWAPVISAIVWLDASDEVLIQRIRTRAKHHRMKAKPACEVSEFLKRYRTAYGEIVSELACLGNIQVLKFHTDDLDPGAMANEVLELCEELVQPRPGTEVFASTTIEVRNDQSIQHGGLAR